MIIVAVDGLVGTGKSTISRLVSEKLGWLFISTGVFYRSVAALAALLKVDIHNDQALSHLLRTELPKVHWQFQGVEQQVHYGAQPLHQQLTQFSNEASIISEHASVRQALLPIQRQAISASRRQGAIIEGRDIGTVVFPAANLKIFMTASTTQRAKRRAAERGRALDIVVAQIQERDQRDSQRKLAPAKQAKDALLLDTTAVSIEQAAAQMLTLINTHLLPPSP